MIRSQEGKINPKQQRFIEYMVFTLGNGAQSARRAGYSPRSAKEIAYQLLQKPIIAEELRKQYKKYGLDD